MACYPYKCPLCPFQKEVVKPMAESQEAEHCPLCGIKMDRIITVPKIIGTTVSFGMKNAFTDPESGREITTWPEWKKAGYKPLKDSRQTKRHTRCNEKIKEKKDKLRGKITV